MKSGTCSPVTENLTYSGGKIYLSKEIIKEEQKTRMYNTVLMSRNYSCRTVTTAYSQSVGLIAPLSEGNNHL